MTKIDSRTARISFARLFGISALIVLLSGSLFLVWYNVQVEATAGTVSLEQKISDTAGGFTGVLDTGDNFGHSVANIGDLNDDGVDDLVVGAPQDDDGANTRGAVWILFMKDDGTVLSHQKISDTAGEFTGVLTDEDEFGYSVAGIGDLDNDGIEDIAVGARLDDDGGSGRGAVWILFLGTDGKVDGFQKISDTVGGFDGVLTNFDTFGDSVANIGDLNDDGVDDLVVGASLDSDGGGQRGSVWILFMNDDGTVSSEQKISDTAGGFDGVLDNNDLFGFSVAGIGDLDNDGVEDIAVGAFQDGDGGSERGAIWILFMNDDGTVSSEQKISDTAGGFTGTLDDEDKFGSSVASIGDLDNDGVEDIAVGARLDDDGGFEDRGAVWILFMNDNGTVSSHQKISDTAGGFTGTLDQDDNFGNSVANIGDLDNDGIDDIAVGAVFDDDGQFNRGAVYILFMNDDGTVVDGTVDSEQKISDTAGGFTGVLDNLDFFGQSVANIGDLDNDGVEDLAVGAPFDDDGGSSRGAVWILFMNDDGTVSSEQKISDTAGGFTGVFDNNDFFGQSVAGIGDLDNDGVEDLAVGAIRDDDGGTDHGAVWILFMNDDGTVSSHQKISDTAGGFAGVFDDREFFGSSVANIGDLDNDGVDDIAVGARGDDDGGSGRGAVWILFMNDDGTVSSHQEISDTAGDFTGVLDDSDEFGESVANIGDLDNDGVNDLAVGSIRDDDGGTDRGAVWILFMETDGTTKAGAAGFQKISDTAGGFTGVLDDEDLFGSSVASIGDLDNDGIEDLAVGAIGDDDGGGGRGAVWILFMNDDGTVKSEQKISDTAGGFTGVLGNEDFFGQSVANIGDLNNDGVEDLAVGARLDDDGGSGRGAVWILFMNKAADCPTSITSGTTPSVTSSTTPSSLNAC